MTADSSSRPTPLSIDAIETLVSHADRRVLFVEPRILRRVIIQDRRIPGLGLRVPHSRVYTIERERLLIIADRSELGLSPAEELPRRMILLGRPTDDEEFARLTSEERLHAFWRLAFHGRVHAEVEQRIEDQLLNSSLIAEYIHLIGAGEFAEIRQVLAKDELLLPPQDDEGAFVEFMAVALELMYFAPWDQRLFFPAIRDWNKLAPLWSDLPHEEWYRETQPTGAPERITPRDLETSPPVSQTADSSIPAHLTADRAIAHDPPLSARLLYKAERENRVGNQVKAAILSLRARKSDPGSAENHRRAAEEYLLQLAKRLQAVWQLSDAETEDWLQALCPLLDRASLGYRSLEARILYDLQKVCIAHERGVYRFDVWRWISTFGRAPLRRELELLETVQSAKYLRTTADRASSIRIPAVDRQRLLTLIRQVQTRSDQQLRLKVRPLIETTFDEVGLVPQNIPERVARRKVIEGLLDRLVERGFITMGDVRDALSQNSLKLPDVSGPLELAWGDRLLRADRKLAQVLDGVYRPGAVYLRASQRLSSLAFGTGIGRLLVRHVVLPFGGAYIALAVLLHVWEGFFHAPEPPPVVVITRPQTSQLATTPASGAPQSQLSPSNTEASASAAKTNPSTEPKNEQAPLAAVTDSTESAGPVPPPESGEKGEQPPKSDGDKPPRPAKSAPLSGVVETIQDAGENLAAKAANALGSASKSTTQAAELAQKKQLPRSFYATWVVLGLFLWAVLHRPAFRRSVVKFLTRLWNASRWLVYELPVSVIDSPLVHRVLDSRGYAVFKGYFLRPAGVTLVLVGAVRFLFLDSLSLRYWLDSFLVLNLFLNSPAGRSLEERVLDICVRAWHELRFRIFAVIYHLVMDLFYDAMQWIEQTLYTVDEWLRFRSGDPRRFVLLKILIGSVWAIVSYVIRFVVTLLVEPQINPIKHFPVVTISHKVLLPYTFHLKDLIHKSLGVTQMTEPTALAIASTIVLLAPGVIGFLVWELKENWQLYVANRSREIRPVRVGSHGEPISGLLRPGFRSGTLAKIYTKLRSALRLESDPGHGYRSTHQLAAIDDVRLAVQRFVERDFCALLDETQLLNGAQITLKQVLPATNRFDLELHHSLHPDRPAIIRWEDIEGWLAASIVELGWIDSLPAEVQQQLNVVFAGLYKHAGVDITREQVLTAVGEEGRKATELAIELTRNSIRLVPLRGAKLPHETMVYSLQSDGTTIQPVTAFGAPSPTGPIVAKSQLLFRDVELHWSQWVEQWSKTRPPAESPARVPDLLGVSSID